MASPVLIKARSQAVVRQANIRNDIINYEGINAWLCWGHCTQFDRGLTVPCPLADKLKARMQEQFR